LLPEAEIITRPRFSTLSYAGPAKLSRLPPRSVIVAFSADEVYALAEALRRFSGGAAVVMGSLSPSTRNAQVAMFQAGEVDYLVATDAIGMGLNLDVAHVAFASLNKFDGQRQRRLTIAEMAQIAGRAGRHQRDGSFGSIGGEAAFTDEEVAAIEGHHMPPIEWLYWRNPAPSTASLAALIADLEAPPQQERLRPAPQATDLAVLKQLADDAEVAARATDPALVARLWSAASLPDFTKSGPQMHARLVARLWSDLSSAKGTIDGDWFAQRLAALDVAEGSIEMLAERIAKVRTCCYIAQRSDWLADPAAGAEAARAVEARLSDALHTALTARFVDRRTAVLLRGLGQGAGALPVTVDAGDGAVRVDGELIGMLTGFAFRVDPAARAKDQRMLMAAAERHLAAELAQRATALAGAADEHFSLELVDEHPPGILWQGRLVAILQRGKRRLAPKLLLVPSITALDPALVAAIKARLGTWLDRHIEHVLAPLLAADAMACSPDTPAPIRALLAALVDGGGVVPRVNILGPLNNLPKAERGPLFRLGIVIGMLDIFMPAMLRPLPQRWRAALAAAWIGCPPTPLPDGGRTIIDTAMAIAGTPSASDYRPMGLRALRIDMVEKLSRAVHAQRAAALEAQTAEAPGGAGAASEQGVAVQGAAVPDSAEAGFALDPALATSFGLTTEERLALLKAFGFVCRNDDAPVADQLWTWRGLRGQPRERAAPPARDGRSRPQRHGSEASGKRRGKTQLGNGRTGSARPSRGPSRQEQTVRAASPFAGLADLLSKASPAGD
jgi:ATP-dependent RNA helicase SUPV3L1/SUV3